MNGKIEPMVTVPAEYLKALIEDTWAAAQNCGRVGIGNMMARQKWVAGQVLDAMDFTQKTSPVEVAPGDGSVEFVSHARGHLRG
jgi:hypothetical protein